MADVLWMKQVQFMNSSMDKDCEAHSDTNTFKGACIYPQNCLKHSKTPMFLRNSMYNYGEWEVTSQIWQQGASVTPDWGANSGCGAVDVFFVRHFRLNSEYLSIRARDKHRQI
jgi:hypothetical protein